MEIEKLSFEDFQIEYCKIGKGKKTIVMLPGLSVKSTILSAAAVEKDYVIFKDEYTIYLIERRINPSNSTTIRSLAEDTIKVIETLGLKDIYLMGASQGGMIALQVACLRGDLIKKLLLCSSSAKVVDTTILDRWINLAKEKKREELFLDFGKCIYPEAIYKKFERVLKVISKSVTDEELERFVYIAGASRGFNLLKEIKDIKCEMMVIGAKDDCVLGGECTEEIAEITGCPIYMYEPGFGHAAYDTAPDYKNRILSYFNK